MPDLSVILGGFSPRHLLLLGSAVFISMTVFFCLLRAMLGPRFTDRIIAANIMGTRMTVLIAILSLIVGDGWLADICLIYTIISFIAVVVLSRSVLKKVKGQGEARW